MEKKVCGKCKEEKELEEYQKLTKSKNGRQNYCKVCMTEYTKKRKEYYQTEGADKLRDKKESLWELS